MSDLICIEDFVPKDQYELDEILQNENGLSMRFSGEYRTIVIEYGYRWIWYSSSDEADRWKTFRKYFGDRNCVETGLFYILNNSKLKKWIIDEKYGVWNEDKLEHRRNDTPAKIVNTSTLWPILTELVFTVLSMYFFSSY